MLTEYQNIKIVKSKCKNEKSKKTKQQNKIVSKKYEKKSLK